MNAQDAYDQLKTAVDDAIAKKNYMYALDAAKTLGMTGGENSHPTHLANYDYKGSYEDGETAFHFESYDASKSFEMKPDVNRFSLELKRDGKRVQSHSDTYED